MLHTLERKLQIGWSAKCWIAQKMFKCVLLDSSPATWCSCCWNKCGKCCKCSLSIYILLFNKKHLPPLRRRRRCRTAKGGKFETHYYHGMMCQDGLLEMIRFIKRTFSSHQHFYAQYHACWYKDWNSWGKIIIIIFIIISSNPLQNHWNVQVSDSLTSYLYSRQWAVDICSFMVLNIITMVKPVLYALYDLTPKLFCCAYLWMWK